MTAGGNSEISVTGSVTLKREVGIIRYETKKKEMIYLSCLLIKPLSKRRLTILLQFYCIFLVLSLAIHCSRSLYRITGYVYWKYCDTTKSNGQF